MKLAQQLKETATKNWQAICAAKADAITKNIIVLAKNAARRGEFVAQYSDDNLRVDQIKQAVVTALQDEGFRVGYEAVDDSDPNSMCGAIHYTVRIRWDK